MLAEKNFFQKGHGVSIGSETSGWIRNITIRDSKLDGTNLAVRRGGVDVPINLKEGHTPLDTSLFLWIYHTRMLNISSKGIAITT